MNNPYNINKDESKFLAWAAGYECNGDIEDNPFSDQTEPQMVPVWAAGYRANKNRPKKGPRNDSGGVSVAGPSPPTPQPRVSSEEAATIAKALSEPPGPVNLALVSLDKLLAEVTKRFKEYEEFRAKYKKVFSE